MKAHSLGIEASQRDWIAQIIEEESRLLRDLIEGKRLNAQSGLFRGTETGNFGGAQFGVCSCRTILRVGRLMCQ